MYTAIMLLGIASLLMVIFMLLTGLRIIKLPMKVHRRVGIVLAITALLHGGLVLFMYL